MPMDQGGQEQVMGRADCSVAGSMSIAGRSMIFFLPTDQIILGGSHRFQYQLMKSLLERISPKVELLRKQNVKLILAGIKICAEQPVYVINIFPVSSLFWFYNTDTFK